MLTSNRPTDSYYQNDRKDLLPLIPRQGTKVLDIGCGEGRFALMLKKELGYKEAWGMEFDERAAKTAETRLDKVLAGDAVSRVSELPDGYFDLVCMNDFLEHLVWPEEFLIRLRPKLSPDGRIVCSIPNLRQFRLLWNLIQHQDFEYEDQGLLDRTHLRFFTVRTFTSMLRRAGYEPVTITGSGGATKSWKFKILNAITLWRSEDMKHAQFFFQAKPV